jgi:putative tricarboxylic transport membrane protein|tara:strand:+ start:773 stop:1237 length:465 start_codon:yes stop_codon:yes gene_type:complete
MTLNYTRISAFVFLLIFLIYSYLAGEIRVFAFDENADFNARTFPKLISYLGIAVSFLTLVLSKNENEDLGQYEWISVLVLFALVFSYGVLIKSIGFFISTNLFLIISYIYLGVRSYKVIVLSSFPVVAGLQFMLHGLLDVYIRDPFLQFLGVIS